MCDLPVHDRDRLVRGRGRQQVHREEQCWLQVFKRCVCGVLWAVPGIRYTLYQRHLLNLSRIRTRHADPVAAHFYTDGHSVADFRVMGLEKLHGSDDHRRTMEQLLNRKLLTYRPYGINTQEWGYVRKWREHYVDVVKNWRHIRFNCIVTSCNKYGRWRRPLGRKLRQKYNYRFCLDRKDFKRFH